MTVVNAILPEYAKLIGSGLGGSKVVGIGLGEGSTAAAVTDTDLETEIDNLNGGGRKGAGSITFSLQTTNITNDTRRYETSWSFAGNEDVNEIATFTSGTPGPASGTMELREVFSAPLGMIAADTLELTIDVITDDKTQDESGRPSQVIPDAGIEAMNRLIHNTFSESRFSHVALDDGTAVANQTQIALDDEFTTSGLARASATATVETVNVTDDTMQLSATFNVTATEAVEGAGCFNASSGGEMGARFLYRTGLNLVNTDTFTENIQIVHVPA